MWKLLSDRIKTERARRTMVHTDVPTGSWRTPFLFPPPLRLVNEQLTVADGLYADKSLGLSEIAHLPL
ncbi:MAG: hypothetical protein ACRD1B_08570 [Thermoanaerobaculia bacterium]